MINLMGFLLPAAYMGCSLVREGEERMPIKKPALVMAGRGRQVDPESVSSLCSQSYCHLFICTVENDFTAGCHRSAAMAFISSMPHGVTLFR